jgi:hypothetical protein
MTARRCGRRGEHGSAVVAHIVGGAAAWPLWLTGTALFGGAVAAMAVPVRWRRACIAAAGVGFVATAGVYVLLPTSPPAPAGLSLRIAAPADGATVTSPLTVRVCAPGMSLPGPGRLLSVSVDGRQVAEVAADSAAVNTTTGQHTLRAELVTTDHRAYAPPVLTDTIVTVSGPGSLTTPQGCAP